MVSTTCVTGQTSCEQQSKPVEVFDAVKRGVVGAVHAVSATGCRCDHLTEPLAPRRREPSRLRHTSGDSEVHGRPGGRDLKPLLVPEERFTPVELMGVTTDWYRVDRFPPLARA